MTVRLYLDKETVKKTKDVCNSGSIEWLSA
jgi:hypothetical protein